MIRRPPRSPLFPYPRLFRSVDRVALAAVTALEGAVDRLLQRGHLRGGAARHARADAHRLQDGDAGAVALEQQRGRDRKSTRLNSSHANISYAVFCLKTKRAT